MTAYKSRTLKSKKSKTCFLREQGQFSINHILFRKWKRNESRNAETQARWNHLQIALMKLAGDDKLRKIVRTRHDNWVWVYRNMYLSFIEWIFSDRIRTLLSFDTEKRHIMAVLWLSFSATYSLRRFRGYHSVPHNHYGGFVAIIQCHLMVSFIQRLLEWLDGYIGALVGGGRHNDTAHGFDY